MLSSRVLSLEICSSIGTSPSASDRDQSLSSSNELVCVWIHSQVHLNDDNVLSVLDYAVAHLHVKHGLFPLIR